MFFNLTDFHQKTFKMIPKALQCDDVALMRLSIFTFTFTVSFQSINNGVALMHVIGMMVTPQATCPTNYTLNPVTTTCIRVIVTPKALWDEAKDNCESEGKRLAVFDTYESVLWLKSFTNDPNTTVYTGKLLSIIHMFSA